MLRHRAVWCAALWFAVVLHLSWHLGRPGHDHRSFGLWYHWIVGAGAALPVAAIANRRFPNSRWPALALMFGLGVLVGQGVEPLGEVVLDQGNLAPFTDGLRWRIFGEFLTAAVVTGVLAVALTRRGANSS